MLVRHDFDEEYFLEDFDTKINLLQALQILDLLSNEKQGVTILSNLGAVCSLNDFKTTTGEPNDMVDKIIDKILANPAEPEVCVLLVTPFVDYFITGSVKNFNTISILYATSIKYVLSGTTGLNSLFLRRQKIGRM